MSVKIVLYLKANLPCRLVLGRSTSFDDQGHLVLPQGRPISLIFYFDMVMKGFVC